MRAFTLLVIALISAAGTAATTDDASPPVPAPVAKKQNHDQSFSYSFGEDDDDTYTASPVPAPVAKRKAVSKKKDVCNTLDVSGTYFVNENVTFYFGMKGTWVVNASHLDNSSDIPFYQKDGSFLYYNGNWTFGSDPSDPFGAVYGYGVGADTGPEDVTAGTWKIYNFTIWDYKTQSATSLAVTCMDKPTPEASDVNLILIGAIVGSICALAGVAAAGLIWRAKQPNPGLVTPAPQNPIRPAEVKKGIEAAGEVEASAIP